MTQDELIPPEDELIPPDRLAFYNRYGREIIASAVEAISDSILEHTGHVSELELRNKLPTPLLTMLYR